MDLLWGTLFPPLIFVLPQIFMFISESKKTTNPSMWTENLSSRKIVVILLGCNVIGQDSNVDGH